MTIHGLLLAILGFASSFWALAPPGQTAATRRVSTAQSSVELITSSATLSRSGEVWVGLRFQLQPGWHVYWRNPGDSGGPPTITWQLPQGVSADEFDWPAPSRLKTGGLVNYGYEGDVVLPVRLRGASPGPASRQPLVANTRWIVCKDVCVPGKARLTIALPLELAERAQVAEWKSRIDAARAAVPKPAPEQWKASARSERDAFNVTITLDRPAPRSAIFFPSQESQIDDSAPQQVTAEGRVLRFRLKKSQQLVDDPPTLHGVVRLTATDAFSVTVPLVGGTTDTHRLKSN
jgi:thiol:disulfide interchange protein DsbD